MGVPHIVQKDQMINWKAQDKLEVTNCLNCQQCATQIYTAVLEMTGVTVSCFCLPIYPWVKQTAEKIHNQISQIQLKWYTKLM